MRTPQCNLAVQTPLFWRKLRSTTHTTIASSSSSRSMASRRLVSLLKVPVQKGRTLLKDDDDGDDGRYGYFLGWIDLSWDSSSSSWAGARRQRSQRTYARKADPCVCAHTLIPGVCAVAIQYYLRRCVRSVDFNMCHKLKLFLCLHPDIKMKIIFVNFGPNQGPIRRMK